MTTLFFCAASLMGMFCTEPGITAPTSVLPQGTPPVKFETIADPVWAIPAKGEATPIALALRATNTSEVSLRIRVLDTIEIGVADVETTRTIWSQTGRDQTRVAGALSDEIAPGASMDFALPMALCWADDGKSIVLTGDDGYGGVRSLSGLRPGMRAQVMVKVSNTRPAVAGRVMVWTGDATARPAAVTIANSGA